MSLEVCKAKIYGLKDAKGKTIPDYIIKSNCDERFLEWQDINPTGIEEVDENLDCSGVVVVHRRSYAEKIIKNLEL